MPVILQAHTSSERVFMATHTKALQCVWKAHLS